MARNTFKPWKIEYSYAHEKTHKSSTSKCRICSEYIDEGAYAIFYLGAVGYYKGGLRVHAKCLFEVGKAANDLDPQEIKDVDAEKKARYKANVAKCSAEAKEAREKAALFKQIIKDALSSQNLKISKCHIARSGGRYVRHGRAKMHIHSSTVFTVSAATPANSANASGPVKIHFENGVAKISKAYHWRASAYPENSPTEQIIEMAHPDAIERLGKAIMVLDNGEFSQHLKKPRKKAKPSGVKEVELTVEPDPADAPDLVSVG